MNDETTTPTTPEPDIATAEKAVAQNVIVALLKYALANGKWAGIVRSAVLLVCGGTATVNQDTMMQVASAVIAFGMIAWSWLDKHMAALKARGTAEIKGETK